MADEKIKVVKTEKSVKLEKAVKPEKAVKLVKPVKQEESIKLVKPVKQEGSVKPVKSIQPEKKRLSKGMRTHNRRLKQEARNPSIVHG